MRIDIATIGTMTVDSENEPEDYIPIKQVLRWQDDGGATIPDTS